MEKDRLLAFSDGVIAVIITIMVLELKVPQGTNLAVLASNVPVFLSYVLSFVYVAIYWNNHHHLFHAVHRILWGQPAPSVLAVAGAILDRVDGPEPFRSSADRRLWRLAADAGDRLVLSADGAHPQPGEQLAARASDRTRLQGQGFVRALHCRHRIGIHRHPRIGCDVRAGCVDVVGSR